MSDFDLAQLSEEERKEFYGAESEFVVAADDGARIQAAARTILALGVRIGRRLERGPVPPLLDGGC